MSGSHKEMLPHHIKREYSAPRLVIHGSIDKITGQAIGGKGGGPPPIQPGGKVSGRGGGPHRPWDPGSGHPHS